jgi:WD40 repeat protein
MPKRRRQEEQAEEQTEEQAEEASGAEAAAGAEAEPADDSAAEQQWHVDYRQPLARWASTALPPCPDASRSCAENDNFVKGVKWSPDGNLLLTNSEDHKLRVWALDAAAVQDAWTPAAAAADDGSVLRLGRHCAEAECIYDFCWYPGARAADPASCCALSCSRDTPLHLWDACPSDATAEDSERGRVRATYLPYDHNDEVAAAMSCCFSPDGQQIYCGFEHAVHVFHTARPGRDSTMRKTTPTRSSRKGQKGLISTLAVTPDGSVYAAGSYSASVGLYSCAEGTEMALLPAGSGVSQVSFAPDGLLLMVGERKSSALTGWYETPSIVLRRMTQAHRLRACVLACLRDMIGPRQSTVYDIQRLCCCSVLRCAVVWCRDIRHTAAPLFTCRRQHSTNQRLQFDIDPCSCYVATGDETGVVRIYDIREEGSEPTAAPPHVADMPVGGRGPGAVCNSVCFHPFLPVLATGSGSRRFRDTEEKAAAGVSDDLSNAVQLHKLAWVRGAEPEPGAASN